MSTLRQSARQRAGSEDINTRVARLEEGLEKVSDLLGQTIEAQQGIAAKLSGEIQSSVGENRRQIADLGEKMMAARATNWPLMVSVTGLIIVVGGIIVGFVNMSQSPMRDMLLDNRAALATHVAQDGHGPVVLAAARHTIEIQELRQSLAKLSETADRRHADFDSRVLPAIAALEARLAAIDVRLSGGKGP